MTTTGAILRSLAAILPEQLVKARVAVRLVVLFFESAFVELSKAKRADEVLRVEFPEHRRDASARDRFVAARA